MLSRYLPKSLFARAVLIFVVPMVLVQVITTIVFIDNHWQKITSRLASGVAGELAIIAERVEADPASLPTLSQAAASKLGMFINFEPDVVMEKKGKNTDGIWRRFVGITLSRELDKYVGRPHNLAIQSKGEEWAEVDIQLKNGVLKAFVLERRLFTSSSYIFLAWMSLSAFILFTVSIIFLRNQIRPIKRLAVAAERFGRGREVRGFRPQGASEVRRAAQAFIDMKSRINKFIDQRTTLLAGVSHDLRTPLTRIKLGLSFLPESPDVDALKSDVNEMEMMVNAYLDFIRGEGDEPFEDVSLGDMLEAVAEPFRREGHKIEIEKEKNIIIEARKLSVSRCLTNIVKNACRHGGGDVHIKLTEAPHNVTITIDDKGEGIPAEKREDVFKPFYRLEKSSGKAGVGLGMTVARDLIQSQGGEIALSESPYGGLRVELVLPKE